MPAKKLPVLGKCQARVLPLTEQRMRTCGKPATARIEGRILCPRHATVARKREAARPNTETKES